METTKAVLPQIEVSRGDAANSINSIKQVDSSSDRVESDIGLEVVRIQRD